MLGPSPEGRTAGQLTCWCKRGKTLSCQTPTAKRPPLKQIFNWHHFPFLILQFVFWSKPGCDCCPSLQQWCFHWHQQPRLLERWTGRSPHHGSQIWTGTPHQHCTPVSRIKCGEEEKRICVFFFYQRKYAYIRKNTETYQHNLKEPNHSGFITAGLMFL